MLILLCYHTFQYLALGSSHFSEQSLGDFGPFHLLLDLIVDGGVDVEDAALRLPVPLAWQRRWFHLRGKIRVRQMRQIKFVNDNFGCNCLRSSLR